MKAREPPPGWVTITDLARERGVDKSAVSRRVSRLESLGILKTQTVGRSKLVNLAEFDRARAETVDAVREANGRAALAVGDDAAPGGDPILAREQAKRAAYDAEMKRLDLEERLGKLVHAENLAKGAHAFAVELGRVIDTLPGRAEALAAAVTKDGVSGLRAALRGFARELRDMLADAAERLADGEAGAELDSDEFDDAPARPEVEAPA